MFKQHSSLFCRFRSLSVLALIFSLFCLSGQVIGQYNSSNLDLDQDLHKWYDSTIGLGNEGLYEGTYFKTDVTPITLYSHLYFGNRNWKQGSLVFRGERYQNVNIHYDLYHDLVLILNKSLEPIQPIKVNQALVSEFIIDDKVFRPVDELNASNSSNGFYEILFEGMHLKLVIKHRKVKEIVDRVVSFEQEDKYYLIVDGQPVIYRGKNTLKKTFKNHKTVLRQMFRGMKLKAKPENDDQIARAISSCDKMISD